MKLSNVYYDNKFFINQENNINLNLFCNNYSTENYVHDRNKELVIIDNLLVMNSLHSCYAHAIIDSCFPIFWAINDIKKENNIQHIKIFVNKNSVY